MYLDVSLLASLTNQCQSTKFSNMGCNSLSSCLCCVGMQVYPVFLAVPIVLLLHDARHVSSPLPAFPGCKLCSRANLSVWIAPGEVCGTHARVGDRAGVSAGGRGVARGAAVALVPHDRVGRRLCATVTSYSPCVLMNSLPIVGTGRLRGKATAARSL